MEINTESKLIEYDILGLKVKLNPSEVQGDVNPDEIVELLKNEVSRIRESVPSLDHSQLFLLAGLQLSKELLTIKKEYKENVETMNLSAQDALRFIEEVSPSAN